ncbi:MAG: hypothetical protein WD844_04165 [Thermoleophilaceae bacterium]
MRLSLTRLRRRAADAADETAGGSAAPAGADPGADAGRRKRPSARERGAMRRRARQLRRRREAMLLELGALLFEMHRRNRREPELLERKAEEIRAVDAEERGLTEALGGNARTVEVVAAGIAGACPSCNSLVSTEARFCERCGTALGRPATTESEPEPAAALQAEPSPTQELRPPDSAEPDAAEPDRAEPDRAEPDAAEPDRAEPGTRVRRLSIRRR